MRIALGPAMECTLDGPDVVSVAIDLDEEGVLVSLELDGGAVAHVSVPREGLDARVLRLLDDAKAEAA
jgi:hypothetical protein